MKKFAKMSLVAAVAVAGLTSTVSAKDLSEAIKGVDVSGSLFFRYDERKDKTGSTNANHAPYQTTKLSVSSSNKVNDNVSVNFGITAFAKDTDTTGSTAGSLNLEDAYFTYTGIANTAVSIGKMPVDTPWTNGTDPVDYSDGGNGITASYNAGFATFAAAHFIQNDHDGADGDDAGSVDVEANDISVVAVIVPAGPVNLKAYYAKGSKTSDTSATLGDGFKAQYYNATAKLAGVALSGTYAVLEGELVSELPKQETMILTASGVAGPVKLGAKFATTGDEGGITAFDIESASTYLGWNISTDSSTKQDAEVFEVSASMSVAPKTVLSAVYVDAEWKNATSVVTEESEWFATLSYAMSKNFSALVRYGQYETKLATATDKTERDRGRIQLAYKF